MGPRNQLREATATLEAVQQQIAVMVEVMTVIRNIAEGRVFWRDLSPESRIRGIQALSDLMHNFIPGDPVMLSAVRSQFAMQQARSPEAFELCPALLLWAAQSEVEED